MCATGIVGPLVACTRGGAAQICMSPRVTCRCTGASDPRPRGGRGGRGAGPDAGDEFAVGDRVGIAWLRVHLRALHGSARGAGESLPRTPAHRLGRLMAVMPSRHCAAPRSRIILPIGYSDTELAPLLCAGIIGYRVSCCGLTCPRAAGSASTGSAAARTSPPRSALAQGAEVHVMTCKAAARDVGPLAGAASAQGAEDRPPAALDAAILFAPSAIWCCRHSRRSTAGHPRHRAASTSATSSH